MCMCGALRRVVICFGWSGVEENRQRGGEEENAGIKDNVVKKTQRCVKDLARSRKNRGGRGRQIGELPRWSGCRKRREIPRFACLRGQARNEGFAAS
jgi:hypothetical protein